MKAEELFPKWFKPKMGIISEEELLRRKKITKYRAIPHEVEALYYDGLNRSDVEEFSIRFFKRKFKYLEKPVVDTPTSTRIYRTDREDSIFVERYSYLVIRNKKLIIMNRKQFGLYYESI